MEEPNEKLFDEFHGTDTATWKQQVIKDLKGKDFDETLVWKSLEGIDAPAYFHEGENSVALPIGLDKETNAWIIRQDFSGTNSKETNQRILKALRGGASSLGIRCESNELPILLKDVFIDMIGVNLDGNDKPQSLLDAYITELNHRGLDKTAAQGAIEFDPIGRLTETGSWINDATADLATAQHLIETCKNQLPNFKSLLVGGNLFHEAGGTIVQELAFSMAQGSDYLSLLSEKGLPVQTIADSMQFHCSIGSNYFLEIAKLRAARWLWDKVLEAYGVENKSCFIHSVTSSWNTSILDAHNNLLRGTTEAMSAILGGCDSLTVVPFDDSFAAASGFSERLARNTQLLLQDEAYLDRVIDPAAGSHYLENLTTQIAQNAWEEFQQTEQQGGFLEALKKGYIQEQITASADKKKAAFAAKQLTLVGVNKYPAEQETNRATAKNVPVSEGIPTVKPLQRFRIAQEEEANRQQ